tara:strand:- start:2332 stop:2673 length:342 start_codon:yes stop_codon:yes gene_type:complete
MRITKNQLKQIIKEELAEVLTISEYSSQSERPGKPEKGSAEYLALTGTNVAGRAARKLKRAFAGSGEEEFGTQEEPEDAAVKEKAINMYLDMDGRKIDSQVVDVHLTQEGKNK